jgi:hypothetical protein
VPTGASQFSLNRVLKFEGRVWSGTWNYFAAAPEIQTDDLDGNKRSIGANPDYQCKPLFESTGRR